MFPGKGLLVGTLFVGLITGNAVLADAIGRLAGEASVEQSGAGRYSMPLPLPAGAMGLQPALAVVHDSRAGNGLLGVGAAISGLSSIQRCGRTIAQDGAASPVTLDANDGYCLDGARLRLTSGVYGAAGSQYQTEIERFARVTAIGAAGAGPASFVVETRDGLRHDYGATADSRIESVGSGTPRAWALNRSRDRQGNYVDFVYAEDTAQGSYRPARIDYTGLANGTPPFYSVRFLYERRPDQDVTGRYVAGGPVREDQRLDRIELRLGGGSLLRRYEFEYLDAGSSGRSRLASVQACAPASCFPATTMMWSQSVAGWREEISTGLSAGATESALPGDADGDGREDLFLFDSAFGRWALVQGTAAGYSGARINTGFGKSSYKFRALAMDADANGTRDLIVPHDGGVWYWLRQASPGSFPGSFTAASLGIADDTGPGNVAVADADGDGREDLVLARGASGSLHSLAWRRNLTSGGAPTFSAEATLWTAPTGTRLAGEAFDSNPRRYRSTLRSADFNGDGRQDLLVAVIVENCAGQAGCTAGLSSYWQVLAASGAGLQASALLPASGAPLLGDFNGDGLTDLLYAHATGGHWELVFAQGARGTSAVVLAAPIRVPLSASTADFALAVADWDGDGRSDVLANAGATGWLQCRSNGQSIESCQPTGIAAASSGAPPKLADVDGDGLADLAYLRGGWNLRLHQPVRPDRLERVTDGFGNWAVYDYRTTTDPTVHTASTTSLYPVRDLRGPIEVVRALRRSDGVGGSSEFTYAYEGAKLDLTGRGFLGFARRTASDGRNGLMQIDDYAQDPLNYERIGRLLNRTVRTATQNLQRTTLTWDRIVSGAPGGQRRFAYPSRLRTEQYETSGTYANQLVGSDETRYTVDAYGTVVDAVTTTVEHASGVQPYAQHLRRTTLVGVSNDAANWCLGRPASVQQTNSHSLPGGSAQTRGTAYTWDLALCRLSQQVAEPALAELRVTTDYAYDAVGHRSAVSVTPNGGTTRTTTTGWSADGRFPSTIVDPLGLRRAVEFDPLHGVLASIVDEVGARTRYEFDEYGRVVAEIRPDATSTHTRFETCGPDCADTGALHTRSTTHHSPSGAVLHTQVTGLDAFGREVFEKTEVPGGAIAYVVTRHDRFGRVQQRSLPAWCCSAPEYWMSYGYDLQDRTVAVTRPASARNPAPLTWRWMHSGFTTSSVDPQGRVQTVRRDPLGRVVQVVDAAGADVDFEFDGFGNLLKLRDYFGNETQHNYDLAGHRTRTIDPNSGTRSFVYSPLGELSVETDAKGQITRYAYDLGSRPVVRDSMDGTLTWTWAGAGAGSSAGRLSSVAFGGLRESFVYDALGRLQNSVSTTDGSSYELRYGYDEATGLPSRLGFPPSTGGTPFTLEYSYDRGRVTAVREAGNAGTVFWERRAVDPSGATAESALGNGVQTLSRHDAVTGLVEYLSSIDASGKSLQHESYTWGDDGNLIEHQNDDDGSIERFEYDSRDRLGRVSFNGTESLRVAYDEIGNITHKSDVGDYRYDTKRRHAVVAAGDNTYAYDANGNLRRANGASISWTATDQPSYIRHSNGNYSFFHYAADGTRYRQINRNGQELIDTLYLLGGLFEKQVQGQATEFRHYVVVDGRRVAVHTRKTDGSSSTEYLLQDHLGSTDAITSESGELLARLSYAPFGQRRASSGQPGAPSADEWEQLKDTTSRGFTGHEHLDNLGLIHMDGRAYDAVLGRFLSPDRFVSDAFNPQAFNRYSYVRNNPLAFIDPSGFIEDGIEKKCWDACGPSGFPWGLQGALLSIPGFTLIVSSNFSTPCVFVGHCIEGAVSQRTPRAAGPAAPVNSLEVPDDGAPATVGIGANMAAGVTLALNLVVPGHASAGNAVAAFANGQVVQGAVWSAAAVAEAGLAVATMGASAPAERASNGIIEIAEALLRGGATHASVETSISAAGLANLGPEVPGVLARVVPSDVVPSTLGRPGVSDVFVTAAEDIAGLNADQLASRLGIPPSQAFTVLEFPTPATGMASPILRGNVGFVGGGRTIGGAREFVIPNGPVPPNAIRRTVIRSER